TADPFAVVPSIAHPGGNITGFSSLISDLHPKRLELLKEVIPGLRLAAFLGDVSNPTFARAKPEFDRAATALGIAVSYLDLGGTSDVRSLIQTGHREGVQAIVVTAQTNTLARRDLIVQVAAEERLPVIYSSPDFVRAGGLVALGIDYTDLYR